MVQLKYTEYVKMANNMNNIAAKKKSLTQSNISIGIVIILIIIIVYLLFKEFLDNYGDVFDKKNRQIKAENIVRAKLKELDNKELLTKEKFEIPTTNQSVNYQIPEPKPLFSNDSYIESQNSIDDIGIIRDVKINPEFIFTKQIALDNEQINLLINESESKLKNRSLVINHSNLISSFNTQTIKTVKKITHEIINQILKVINESMVELNLYQPNHDIDYFKLMGYRVVNTLTADTAYYNDVWVEEKDKPDKKYPRNQVDIRKVDVKGVKVFKAFPKQNTQINGAIDVSKFKSDDYLLLDKFKEQNLPDFRLDLNSSTAVNNKFHIRIGRDYEHQVFSLYLDTKIKVIDNNNIRIKLKTMNLIEIKNQYSLIVDDDYDVKSNYNPITKSKNNLANTVINKKPFGFFHDKDIPANYFDEEFKRQHMDKYYYNKAVDDKNSKKKCFAVVNGKSKELKNYDNKLYCESYHSDIDQIGVWDGPCQKNEECPFYKANKNYSNEFGGCKGGYCEMPLGVNRVGFTKYTKDEPYCYNCPVGSDSKCCNNQYLNSQKDNSEILSPDLVFIGDCETDNKFRKSYLNQKLLEEKGLNICPAL